MSDPALPIAVGLAVVGSYLLGAVPFSFLIPKLFYGVDIRRHGSGNVGATNVVRTLGKGPGFACFALDLAKGALPVAMCQAVPGVPAWLAVVAAAFAVVGHSKSVFLGFGGGKAVATGVGTIVALNPLVGLACLAIWAIVFLATRVVSVGSITAALALPGLMMALPNPFRGGQNPDVYTYYAIAAGAFVILRHRENIRRIMDGTEPKFGEKPGASGSGAGAGVTGGAAADTAGEADERKDPA